MGYHEALPSIEMLVSGFITTQVSVQVSSGHFLEKWGRTPDFSSRARRIGVVEWRAGPIHGAANRRHAVPSGATDRFESVRAGHRVGDGEFLSGNPDIMRRPGNRDGPCTLLSRSAHRCTAKIAATVLVVANGRGGCAVVVIVVVPVRTRAGVGAGSWFRAVGSRARLMPRSDWAGCAAVAVIVVDDGVSAGGVVTEDCGRYHEDDRRGFV